MSTNPKMTPEVLYEKLKPLQEAKGYYFNGDHSFTMDVLTQLLETKDRYGYMVCPCRLCSGVKEKDQDILCPCVYRTEDVKEYGSCFCGLYVSKEWNEGKLEKETVPERRPVEKIFG